MVGLVGKSKALVDGDRERPGDSGRATTGVLAELDDAEASGAMPEIEAFGPLPLTSPRSSTVSSESLSNDAELMKSMSNS